MSIYDSFDAVERLDNTLEERFPETHVTGNQLVLHIAVNGIWSLSVRGKPGFIVSHMVTV